MRNFQDAAGSRQPSPFWRVLLPYSVETLLQNQCVRIRWKGWSAPVVVLVVLKVYRGEGSPVKQPDGARYRSWLFDLEIMPK